MTPNKFRIIISREIDKFSNPNTDTKNRLAIVPQTLRTKLFRLLVNFKTVSITFRENPCGEFTIVEVNSRQSDGKAD